MKFYDMLAEGHGHHLPFQSREELKQAHDSFKEEVTLPDRTIKGTERRKATASWQTEQSLWRTALKDKKAELEAKYLH